MKARLLFVVAGLAAALSVGCNSGSSRGQANFGPGSGTQNPGGTGVGQVGSLTDVAPLTTARSGHTANVLPNGNVLIVGGDGDSFQALTFHVDAEVYDPNANTWTVVSTLSPTVNEGRLVNSANQVVTGRVQHTATTISGGDVLIAGGLGIENTGVTQPEGLATSFVFRQATNTFVQQPDMPVARYFHLDELLSDGTVLVTAGYSLFQVPGQLNQSLTSADIFDPQGTWTSVGGTAGGQALQSDHTWGNMVTFQNNALVLNGGKFDNVASSQNPTFIQVFGWPPGVVMPGTQGSNGGLTTAGEVYAVQTGAFAAGPGTIREVSPSGVLLSGATVLSTGDVFFAGGENLAANLTTRFNCIATTEILEATTGAMKAGPNLGSSSSTGADAPTTSPVCVEIGGTSDVLIIGGVDSNGQVTNRCEVWGVLNNTMIGELTMTNGRQDFAAVKLPGGNKILIIGGSDSNVQPITGVELYDR